MVENLEPEREFSLNRSASHLLHRAQQFASEQFEGMNAVGVTLRQFAVLAAVIEQEGCSQSDLVKATGIDRSTLADMVSRMEKNGLIERRQAKLDARAKSVHMTEAGRTSFEKALPVVEYADNVILDLLPRNRRRSFIGILGLLANVESGEAFDELDSPVDVKAKKKINDAKDEEKKKKDKKDKKAKKKKKKE